MSKQRQRGANIVEAAFTLVVLFFFLLGIMDLGRAFNVYQTMTDAAREGARFAVAPCSILDASGCTYGAGSLPTNTDVQAKVRSFLDVASVKNSTVTVSQLTPSINGSTWKYTQVNVTTPYTFIYLPFSMTLHAQSVMRNENN